MGVRYWPDKFDRKGCMQLGPRLPLDLVARDVVGGR